MRCCCLFVWHFCIKPATGWMRKKVFLFLTAPIDTARNGAIVKLLSPSPKHGANRGIGQWLVDITTCRRSLVVFQARFACYFIEYSLSVDNLFVFIVWSLSSSPTCSLLELSQHAFLRHWSCFCISSPFQNLILTHFDCLFSLDCSTGWCVPEHSAEMLECKWLQAQMRNKVQHKVQYI